MDQDLDGWAAEWGDCDDNNPEINPSAPEIPDDGIDQNCNGMIDEPDGNGGGDSPTVSTTKVAGTDYCYATAFSLPIGAGGPYNHCKDGDGWYVATEFRQASPCGGWSGTTHLGEDWNKETGGNSDLGAPVNATADGVVVYVKTTTGDGWGQVVIVRHDAAPGAAFALPGGGTIDHVYSQYAHLQNIAVTKGIAIAKGQKLAEIGPHPGGAHLHFEISRPDAPTFPGPGYSSAAQGRVDPTDFIAANKTVTATCGGAGQPCCANTCDGPLSCNGGLTCSPTGTCETANLCGNGTINAGEQCDGGQLGGGTCQSQGFTGGTLSCAANCQYNTANCTTITCGNGTKEPNEQCDGNQLGGATCQSQGFAGGTLSCSANCTYNTANCTKCGNGVKDAGEQCDGGQLGGATCQSQGFTGGTLSCSPNCTYNTANCTTISCGNGIIEAGEQCEGNQLGGATCQSQGYNGGTLSCSANCMYNTANCTTMICGNGMIEGAEQCDGNQFGGQTCQSMGYSQGTLSCSNCTISTSSCCNNECTTLTCISNNAYQQCGNYDADVCSEYGSVVQCQNGQICSNGCACPSGNNGQFSVTDYAYPNFSPAGCSGDGLGKLKAAAAMTSPTQMTVYVRKSDNSTFTSSGTLSLYVGTGPTCVNPPNVVKATAPIVVGQAEQQIKLTVNPYSGAWAYNETKIFWVGKDEGGFQAYRASGTFSVVRSCIP